MKARTSAGAGTVTSARNDSAAGSIQSAQASLDGLRSQLINAGGATTNPLASVMDALAGSSGTRQSVVPRRTSRDTDYALQNANEDKDEFLHSAEGHQAEDYLKATRTAPFSKYEIKAGWMLPAVLEQELNSDLPGLIRAMVRENVYDTVSGKYLLVPAGSRLIGTYNSHTSYGQGAVQAVWTRLIFPDGSSLDLGCLEGDTPQGSSGFRDKVNNHWGKLVSGALLTSLFAAGIEISQRQNQSVLQNPNAGQTASAGVGQQIGQLGSEVTRRNLNIQPTLKIRPGYRFFVRVERDIVFTGPYNPLPAVGD